MVKKYIMKDSTVEAIYYDGTNVQEVVAFADGKARVPYAAERDVIVISLETRYGLYLVYPDMYVVRLPDGHLSYMSVDIFKSRYEEM